MSLPSRAIGLAVLALASCSKGSDSSTSRRAVDSTRIAEGETYVRMIARNAVHAYERESIDEHILETDTPPPLAHELCKDSTAVPEVIPSGNKYQASSEPGRDFATGDVKTGWKCLKFALSSPTSFQIQYRRGAGYKGPARGGPDPGPEGFEAAAEADLDGDGKKTTLITMTGVVDEATHSVKLAPEPFIAEE